MFRLATSCRRLAGHWRFHSRPHFKDPGRGLLTSSTPEDTFSEADAHVAMTELPGDNTVGGRLIKVEHDLKLTNKDIHNLTTKIDQGFAHMDLRFAHMDQRFAQLESWIQRISTFVVGTVALGTGGLLLKVLYYDQRTREQTLSIVKESIEGSGARTKSEIGRLEAKMGKMQSSILLAVKEEFERFEKRMDLKMEAENGRK